MLTSVNFRLSPPVFNSESLAGLRRQLFWGLLWMSTLILFLLVFNLFLVVF